ncbi:tetratricopeptide repeat protein [Phenylobacterium sp.]|uniref:tetratricopeptide repeat protein n=1 Tax=Phenylobacterium sp. TaxID=1871053 RepID=UPI001229303F|nr:tetratricopeptide repeat protein [Phenylobacterium sp.]THD58891.1 MAG: tetratricopeptide repeat protein [Phenylobacterium sp.]
MGLQEPDAATLQAICDQGLAHHQAGRLEAARQHYEHVLAADPRHFDALHLLGVYAVQTRQLEAAVDLIGQAIAVKGDVARAYGNLANALNGLGRHEDAVAASDQAIALDPDFAEAHGNRGQALRRLGRPLEALASYQRVVALRPTAQAAFNQATLLRELGHLDEALAGYDQAIALKPDYAEAHRSRGITLGDLGRLPESLASFERAVALNPAYAEAHVSLGKALRELGAAEAALASQDRAIALSPDHAEAHGNRGNALVDLGRPAEALASYARATVLKPDYVEALSNRAPALRELERADEALDATDAAIALKPDYAEAHNNRGGALYDLRRLDEALASYDRAIALKPDYAEAHSNRGVVLYDMRRPNAALASYDQAIALKPDFAEAHHHRAMCLLLLGDFAQGWAQYEWRWRTSQFGSRPRPFAAPLWLGEASPAGKILLVHCEQGLGDSLQFCRYVPRAAALGAKVVLEVQPGLERLLARLPGVARVVTRGEPLPPHDLQTPLMSLPFALGATLDAWDGSYLQADPDEAVAMAGRMPGSGRLRVGLCWAGGLKPGQLIGGSIDKRRSLALEAFAPLAAIDGIEVYSLQKGPPAAGLAEARARGWAGPEIVDLTGELKDFADTAALAANLDLVIACDTAVAHLAGGMGKPVWILNRFDACWRWLDGRTDSPWYPSARLFIQPAPGDWASVMDQVQDELAALAREAAP